MSRPLVRLIVVLACVTGSFGATLLAAEVGVATPASRRAAHDSKTGIYPAAGTSARVHAAKHGTAAAPRHSAPKASRPVPRHGAIFHDQLLAMGAGSTDESFATPLIASYSVSLYASTTSPKTGESVTLTADASRSVTSSGYSIMIVENGGVTPVAQCSTGDSCQGKVSRSSPGSQTYVAFIGNKSEGVAESNLVTVTWSAPPATGTLVLQPSGLPADGSIAVEVTGPDSYFNVVTVADGARKEITGLTPGTYQVLGSTETANGDFFYPSESPYSTNVPSGGRVSQILQYLTTPEGVVSVQITNAPVDLSTYQGGNDEVQLVGTNGDADGFGIQVSQSGPVSAIPGGWSVSARTFSYGGSTYTPVLSTTSLDVAAGGLVPLQVTYVPSSSSVSVTPLVGTNQSALPGTPVDSPPSVYVQTPSDQPDIGVPVNFTIQPGANGASGTFQNGAAEITETTNAQGIAETPLTTGSIIGNYQIAASTAGAGSNATFNASTMDDAALSDLTSTATATVDEGISEVASEVGGALLGAPFIGDTVNTAAMNSAKALWEHPQQALNQGGEFFVFTLGAANPAVQYVCDQSAPCALAFLGGEQETVQTVEDAAKGINGAPFVWALQTAAGVLVGVACEAPTVLETLGTSTFVCVALGTAASSVVAGWLGSQADASMGNQTLTEMANNASNGISPLEAAGQSSASAEWNSLTNAAGSAISSGSTSADEVVGALTNWLSGELSGANDVVTNDGDVTATTTSQQVSVSLSGGISQVWVASLADPFSASAAAVLATPVYGAISVAPGSSASSGSLEMCSLSGPEAELVFWDGGGWEAFSSQSFDPSSDCVTAEVSDSSTPSVGELLGTTTWVAAGMPKASVSFRASASPESTSYGNTVTLSATGLPASATGSVTFSVEGSELCSAAVSSGSASCVTDVLPAGDYSVSAAYSGDANYQEASAPASFSVAEAPKASITAPASGGVLSSKVAEPSPPTGEPRRKGRPAVNGLTGVIGLAYEFPGPGEAQEEGQVVDGASLAGVLGPVDLLARFDTRRSAVKKTAICTNGHVTSGRKCLSHAVSYGHTALKIPAAGVYELRVKPSATALAALKKGKTLIVRLTLVFTPADTSDHITKSVTVKVHLKLKK